MRWFTKPGLGRCLWMIPLFFGIGVGIMALVRWLEGWDPVWLGEVVVTRLARDDPDGLPRRDRLLRLLGAVRDRRADGARGPLGAWRKELARLLTRQHRPQGDRDPVHRHDVHLLPRRRPARDDLPRRARQLRRRGRGQPDVQRPRLRSRRAPDLPLHRAGLRRHRELRDPADDRRAGHGVPAPERPLVLAAPDRRRDDAVELPRAGRRVRERLDVLRAALHGPAARQRVLQHGRPVGWDVVDHDGAQLPRHDHHDAGAGHDVLAHAASRLGQLHDVAARRARDAVHRRVAVLRHVRPGAAHELLRRRRGRLPARVPAHLLVLLPPGRLHHAVTRLRDHLGGDLDVLAEAGLRLPADGAVARRDPLPRILGMGAPHVRRRHGAVAPRADDADDAADRGADGDQGLLAG